MKINLGCYDKKFPKPYINVDIREDVNPDIVDDGFKLDKFNDSSVDLIYCCHMFEHLNKKEALIALRNWHRVLKVGGILRLAVPDFEQVVKRYIETDNLLELDNLLHGSQKHKYDYHYCSYDFKKLEKILLDNKFCNITRWNWWEVEPNRYIDDFSKCYLPSDKPDIALSHNRIIKNTGRLMSLNIQAIKC